MHECYPWAVSLLLCPRHRKLSSVWHVSLIEPAYQTCQLPSLPRHETGTTGSWPAFSANTAKSNAIAMRRAPIVSRYVVAGQRGHVIRHTLWLVPPRAPLQTTTHRSEVTVHDAHIEAIGLGKRHLCSEHTRPGSKTTTTKPGSPGASGAMRGAAQAVCRRTDSWPNPSTGDGRANRPQSCQVRDVRTGAPAEQEVEQVRAGLSHGQR